MAEYALILFLFSNGGHLEQTTDINLGFKTEKLCKEAGEKTTKRILNESSALGNKYYNPQIRFICVKTK